MGEDNHADVWAAFGDPAVVHGMCEDYRAGLRVDRAHEEADRAAGRKDPVSDAAARLDGGRPGHPRRPRGDLAAVDGPRAAQPPARGLAPSAWRAHS
jgi:hypothetical protein